MAARQARRGEEDCRGYTLRLSCRACKAQLHLCALADTRLETPKVNVADGSPLDWRLFLAAAPDVGVGSLEHATDDVLRCRGCEPHVRHIELLPASNTRWRAVALGEAVVLELDHDGSEPRPRQLVVSASAFIALWRSAAAPFLIDVREPAAFAARHLRGSTSMPWHAFEKGVAQLPVASEHVLWLAPADCLTPLLAFALIRGRQVRAACADSDELWDAAALEQSAPNDSGSMGRLPLLTSEAEGSSSRRSWAPSPLLSCHLPLLWPLQPLQPSPPSHAGQRGHAGDAQDGLSGAAAARAPIALDLGCGSGRDAVFLAKAGWAVVAVDSDARALVRLALLAAAEGLPVQALDEPCARAAAARNGGPPELSGAPAADGLERRPQSPSPRQASPLPTSATQLTSAARSGAMWTLCSDLSVPNRPEKRAHASHAPAHGAAALAALPRAELILFVRYLNRPLLRWARGHVRPGGVVVVAHFLRGAELVGRQRPRKPEDMLERGELARLFSERATGAGTDGGAAGSDECLGREESFSPHAHPASGRDHDDAEFDIELNDESAQAEDGRPMVFFVARRRVTRHDSSSASAGDSLLTDDCSQ